MLPNSTLCSKAVGSPCCKSTFIKYGKSPQGKQRYRCTSCGKTQVATYTNKAYQKNTNTAITKLLREGVGVLGTARLLEISPTTVLSRIRRMAENIKPPPLAFGTSFEVDELLTFVKHKQKRIWVVCAFCRECGAVVRFNIGPRTNKTLRHVITSLELAEATAIYTDKLRNYTWLIAEKIHQTKKFGTNHVERAHLTLRTHLKRLNRKTLGYSRSAAMLSACLKVYLWA